MTSDPNNTGINRTAAVGQRQIWGGFQAFGLRHSDRRQHVFLLGQTGTGKSSLIKNLLIQDMQAGEGIALIDPHGDLAEEVLDFVPPDRSDHLVYFNPADLSHPLAYNILASASTGQGSTTDDIHLLASGIVTAFKSVWANSWGPRLEYLLYVSVAALAECCQKTGNVSLLGLPKILTDDQYRDWVLKHVADPAILSYWKNEYERYDARLRAEVISPLQNKIGALLTSVPIRNTLGQVRKSFDLRFVMDHKRIFIANLSKGRLGEDKSNLLGALLVSQFEQAALSRANMQSDQRRDHFLFIDEFQNYSVDSIAGMMAESRKYKLNLTLGCQHTSQLLPEVRDAILGNCGTLISFRISEKDASILSREYGDAYSAEQFTDLANFEILVKALDAGRHPGPFRGTTLPPLGRYYGRREKLIQLSRERYATPRSIVEDRIRRAMGRGCEKSDACSAKNDGGTILSMGFALPRIDRLWF